MDEQLLQEQIDYYRARAAEYDEWFYRRGRYNHGEAENQRWFAEAAEVRAALLNLPRQTTVLELAAGTGIWTQELLNIADHITVVDASPEMLAIHRAKLQSEAVTYQQADLFQSGGTTLTRRLNNGAEYQIVKVFYEPDALREHLAQAGMRATARTMATFFLYAHGQKD